jgi:hypothetical protein
MGSVPVASSRDPTIERQKMFGRDLSKLTSLNEDTPDKLIAVVRQVWPDIKAALENGHTLKVVHSRLAECGIVISYRVLTCYVSRLRREEHRKRSSSRPPQGKRFCGEYRNGNGGR